MTEKQAMRRKIWQIDFSINELNLFLDSNPNNQKAIKMLENYRKMRENIVATYKAKYGNYISTFNDVPAESPFSWINGPWPWEREFNEGESK